MQAMSLLQHQFILTTILLLLISLSQAVLLDGPCENDGQCDGTNMMICRDRRCQCNAPWYKPCNNGCERRINSFYEGEQCLQDDHCLENARCNTQTKRCTCQESYSPDNGLCYKAYNVTCAYDGECWSRHCDNTLGRCLCRPGYELSGNGRCRRRLVRSYRDWATANASNAYCFDNLSCQDVTSICRVDLFEGRFCQCPPDGYTLNEELQKCEIIETSELAPFYGLPTSNNANCTFCQAKNSVCVRVNRENTCWCRAGYDKTNNECRSIRSVFIFPNNADRTNNVFDTGCPSNTSISDSGARLCSCADFHEFDPATRLCKKIERKWINEDFEYGLCTRITYDDKAESNNALCPPPLQCQLNREKYVCSCGENSTLEATRCVLRLGKDIANLNGRLCPENADFSNRFCRCRAGFKEVDDGRRCELILSQDESLNNCENDRNLVTNQTCTDLYGGAAYFCRLGECRCNSLKSFTVGNNSRCYGLLNEPQTSDTWCPPNSETERNRECRCRVGYVNSTDRRRCELKFPLYEWSPSSSNYGSVPAECQAYQGVLANIDPAAGQCRCEKDFYKSPNGTQCWPLLYTNLTRLPDNGYLTMNVTCDGNPTQCRCVPGYRPTSSAKKDCERIREPLYRIITLASSDIDRITDTDCRAVFGVLSIANNSLCICRENIAFASDDGYRCYAFLNIDTSVGTLGNDSCPRYASIPSGTSGICRCNLGYLTSQTGRTCMTISYPLNGTKVKNSNPCVNHTDEHCKVKYGEGAFCEKDQCWCDRRVSFKVNDNQCELFSKYVFPGRHERNNFSCDTKDDCIRNGADVNTVECKASFSDGYKLCVCKDGWLLNPRTQLCENRCPFNCADRPNSECQSYECVCKAGFIERNNTCVSNPNNIELYKTCNSSAFAQPNDPYRCSSCLRGDCLSNYRDTGFRCERYNFENSRCFSKDANFCNGLFEHSECERDDNRCVCSPGYYQEGDRCIRPYNFKCDEQLECGPNANCVDRRCQCNSGRRILDARDSFGRVVQRCTGGGEQLRLSGIVLFVLFFVRLYFV